MHRLLFSILIITLIVISRGGAAVAGVGSQVSFSWQANPLDDYIVGYRLYYGGSSRYNAKGKLKTDFAYDYYIDFAKGKRCVPGSSGRDCEFLGSQELQCTNLSGQYPSCTIYKLHGHLYFALTAYNTQAESGFTPELKATVNPLGLAAVQEAITALLLAR